MRQGRTWWGTCHLQAQCPLRCGTRSPAGTRHWMEQPPYSPCPCSTETELHPEREWTSCSQKSEEQKEVMRILLLLVNRSGTWFLSWEYFMFSIISSRVDTMSRSLWIETRGQTTPRLWPISFESVCGIITLYAINIWRLLSEELHKPTRL